jgi:Uma2 family endonuclease
MPIEDVREAVLMSLDEASMSPELATLIEARQRLGQDRFDEVWDGVYVVAPDPTGEHAELAAQLAVLLHPRARSRGSVVTAAFNLGAPRDFRVPDLGVHRERPRGVWRPSAALVVEVLSPRDRAYEKFGFYAAHRVQEIVIVRPVELAIEIWRRGNARYERVEPSEVLGVAGETLAE